ncbi:hypothetical protein [Lentzea sp. NBRC 102530]|uniref:hypothetical protein n=1 Tax=Lentzea sp. NBRC 102530 TaxID=3032201 RepID=UPI0024A317FE|nr:hypothetical protein [Lentzea sp. NBRC 102530]GLY54852.1 hypothetical protein Lesp01_85070 [Lentzea sp. NBRC 102530]
MRPWDHIRVGFDADYETTCSQFGGGWQLLDRWRELGTLLSGRHGWHFDLHGGGPTWSFGLFSEGLLVLHVTAQGQFYCHDHVTDSDTVADDLAQVEAWIDSRTVSAEHPSAPAVEMAKSFNWKTLTIVEFRLLVSWSDGSFAGSWPSHSDAVIAPTLQEVLDGAAAQVCALYGAPPELAAELTIRAELDPSAVTQLRQTNSGS